MPENIGRVNGVLPNVHALVVTKRNDACGGCSTPSDCSTCLATANSVSEVRTSLRAKTGDIVRIVLPTGELLKGAALFYLFPAVGLLIGAIIGASPGVLPGLSQTAGAILLGACGFGFSLSITVLMARRSTTNMPEIDQIIAPGPTTIPSLPARTIQMPRNQDVFQSIHENN